MVVIATKEIWLSKGKLTTSPSVADLWTSWG